MKVGKVIYQVKRRLLFIINSTLIGGHEMQAKHLIEDLIKNDNEIVILCPTVTVCDFFKSVGAIVHCAPFNIKGKLWKQIFFVKKTSKLITQYAAEYQFVIVSGGSIEATINPVMAIRTLNPLAHVVSYVPMYIDRTLTHGWFGCFYNLILNIIAKVTDEYWTINRIQAYIIRKKIGISTNYIPNRVRSVRKPTHTFGPRLVYVGRFDNRQKDVDGLLNLLDHPKNPYKNILLIGDGPDRQIVIDAIKNAQYISTEIKGWLSPEQIDHLIGLEDVLILNSRWEGEPLVVREFLEKGLTCIARDIVGVRGLIGRKMRFQSQNELLSILIENYRSSRSASLCE